MKRHFKIFEFFKNNGPTDSQVVIEKIEWWIDTLSPIREMLGFPIKITDAVRYGEGTSQHYYEHSSSRKGAIDIRPSDTENDQQFVALGLMLAAHPKITRVCWYSPSERFTWGGFHCDCKADKKQLFVNAGNEIDWEYVKPYMFINHITIDKS